MANRLTRRGFGKVAAAAALAAAVPQGAARAAASDNKVLRFIAQPEERGLGFLADKDSVRDVRKNQLLKHPANATRDGLSE